MQQLIKLPLSDDRKKELVGYCKKYFKACQKARTAQIEDKYNRWQDNYAGKPMEAVRTTPFLRASNFIPQLIRMHCDVLVARLYGLLMAAKPFWRPVTLLDGVPHEVQEGLAEWMEFLSFFQVNLPTVLDSALRRTTKCGTMIMKGPWVTDQYWFPTMGEGGKVTGESVQKEYLQLQCLPFEDFWAWPITANDLSETKIQYHRLRFTKEEVQQRIDSGDWDKAAAEKLMKDKVKPKQDSARENKATDAGIELKSDVDRPFTAIEAHLRYDVQAGQSYKIIITFDPYDETNEGYLKGYFSPYRNLENCFCDLVMMPREDLIYGYSIPEVLEQYQEEQSQIHNSRRDASTITNIPGWKKKRDANVPNPSTSWYPGFCFTLENMDDLAMLQFSNTYNPMMEEESMVMMLAEKATGVPPAASGSGAGTLSGKRGIYSNSGTLALLAEGNRRIDMYLKRMRIPMHRLGNLMYQSYKTFRPEGAEYKQWGATGEAITRSFKFAEPKDYCGYFFEMSASDSSANKETDRTALLLMANTMAAYYRQMVEAAATVAQVPEGNPLREVLLTVLDGAKDLASRLLFAFDIGDRKRLLPDMRQLLGSSPQAGADQANALGMPDASQPLSVGGVQGLQQRLAAIQGGRGAAAGGGNGVGPNMPGSR